MKFKIFLAAVFLSQSVSATWGFTVFTNLTELRRKGFSKWTVVSLADHSKRQPTQPPKEWTNLTFVIPDYATAVQITSADASGNLTHNRGGYGAVIPYWTIDELSGEFTASVKWWWIAWNMSVGFLVPQA